MATNWQYAIVRLTAVGDKRSGWLLRDSSAGEEAVNAPNPKDYLDFLNAMGRQGWELVSQVALSAQGDASNDYRLNRWDLTFKRPQGAGGD